LIIFCTVTPWKCCAPAFSVQPVLIAVNARFTSASSLQIQLHAAHVGLVRDGFGIEFEHDRDNQFRWRAGRLPLSVVAILVITVGIL
jgi:hypothetical protein